MTIKIVPRHCQIIPTGRKSAKPLSVENHFFELKSNFVPYLLFVLVFTWVFALSMNPCSCFIDTLTTCLFLFVCLARISIGTFLRLQCFSFHSVVRKHVQSVMLSVMYSREQKHLENLKICRKDSCCSCLLRRIRIIHVKQWMSHFSDYNLPLASQLNFRLYNLYLPPLPSSSTSLFYLSSLLVCMRWQQEA